MSSAALRQDTQQSHDALLRYAGMRRSYYEHAARNNPESCVVGHMSDECHVTHLMFIHCSGKKI